MKAPTIILSHAAIAGLGWAFVATTFPQDPPEIPGLFSKASSREQVVSSPARALLAQLEAGAKHEATDPSSSESNRIAIQEASEKRLATLTLPDDLETAVSDALDRDDPPAGDDEVGALILAWGRRDPAHTVEWMMSRVERAREPVAIAIGEKLGYEIDPSLALTLRVQWRRIAPDEPFAKGLARQIIATMSDAEIEQIIRKSRETQLSKLDHAIAASWPEEKIADLVKLAVSLDSPAMLYGRAESLQRDEGILFLHHLLSLDLDPSFVRGVLPSLKPVEFVASAKGVDPDLRAEILIKMGGLSTSTAETRKLCIEPDVSAFLFPTDQPAPVQAFKAEKSDAISLLREFTRRYPQYQDEQDLRISLFKGLGLTDPLRAAALLEPLKQDQQEAAVESLLKELINSSPEPFFKAISLLPVPTAGDGEALELRYARLEEFVFLSLNRFGESLPDWVQNLPTGVNRDLALAAVARGIERRDPEKAARLRERISDPHLRSFR